MPIVFRYISLSQRLRSFSFWQHKFRPTISTAKLIKRFFSVCDYCVTRWREQRCLLTTAVNLSVRERHNCHLWQNTILPFWSDGTIKVEIIVGHKFYLKQTLSDRTLCLCSEPKKHQGSRARLHQHLLENWLITYQALIKCRTLAGGIWSYGLSFIPVG